MKKKRNIRLYDTEAEYLVEKDSFELPNVSLVEDINEVFYNPFIKNDYLKLKYNVTSTSEATPLISESRLTYLEEIIIDGNNMSPVKEYTFATTGEHEVWFKSNTNSLIGNYFGNNIFNIKEVIEIPTELITLGNGIFAGNTNIIKANLYTPNGELTTITAGAFNGCVGLTELILPNSISFIDSGSFYGAKIEKLVLPASLTAIYNGNWQQNPNLKEVIIPEGLEIIGSAAFWECTGLTEIVLPSTITEIQTAAFQDNSGLIKITSLSTIAPVIDEFSFDRVAPNGTLYVPYGCTEAYAQWMSTEEGYLGAQGWTIQELPQE